MNDAMTITPSPKSIAIAVLGAAVIGLGTVVAADHLAGGAHTATAPETAAASPALRNFIGTAATGSAAATKGAMAQQFAQLFGLTPDQLKNEVLQGRSLDQIAGPNDQTIKNEIAEYVNAAVDQAVVKGALSRDQAASVKNDLTDLITQLFAADLGKVRPAG